MSYIDVVLSIFAVDDLFVEIVVKVVVEVMVVESVEKLKQQLVEFEYLQVQKFC
jgi:hypothetical protein